MGCDASGGGAVQRCKPLHTTAMFRAARRVLLRRRCSARFGTSTTPAIPICDNLKSRELLADCTSSAVDKLIQASDNVNTVSAYLGMDPTAKSLHVGNLAAIMALRVLQQDYGVRPVLVIGSATAMVGDPSGRSTERPLLDQTTIEQNAQSIAASLTGLLDFDCPSTGCDYHSCAQIECNVLTRVVMFCV